MKRLRLSYLIEIHQLLRLLEPEAVRRAVAASGATEHLRRARELAARMLLTDDVGEWLDLNRSFQAALFAELPQQRLLTLLRGLRDDADLAAAIAREHLDLTAQTLERSSAPFDRS